MDSDSWKSVRIDRHERSSVPGSTIYMCFYEGIGVENWNWVIGVRLKYYFLINFLPLLAYHLNLMYHKQFHKTSEKEYATIRQIRINTILINYI